MASSFAQTNSLVDSIRINIFHMRTALAVKVLGQVNQAYAFVHRPILTLIRALYSTFCHYVDCVLWETWNEEVSSN